MSRRTSAQISAKSFVQSTIRTSTWNSQCTRDNFAGICPIVRFEPSSECRSLWKISDNHGTKVFLDKWSEDIWADISEHVNYQLQFLLILLIAKGSKTEQHRVIIAEIRVENWTIRWIWIGPSWENHRSWNSASVARFSRRGYSRLGCQYVCSLAVATQGDYYQPWGHCGKSLIYCESFIIIACLHSVDISPYDCNVVFGPALKHFAFATSVNFFWQRKKNFQ